RAWPQDPQKSQARHLRRAWRRSGLGGVLSRGRARLRVVLAVSRADRAARRGAGRARRARAPRRVTLQDAWSWLTKHQRVHPGQLNRKSAARAAQRLAASPIAQTRGNPAINAFATLTRQ